jgi:hypothetical protein
VDALFIVVAGKLAELALKIQAVPEQYVIQILSADSADQPFDERVRAGHEGYGFNFFNLQYPQICSPAMESEQRIVVRTEMLREPLSRCGVAQRYSVLNSIEQALGHSAEFGRKALNRPVGDAEMAPMGTIKYLRGDVSTRLRCAATKHF